MLIRSACGAFPKDSDRRSMAGQAQEPTVPPHAKRVCLFGCGRWLRCDDQTGLLIAEAIAALALPGVVVRLSEAPAADLPVGLDGADLLIVVDAARSNERFPPGTWQRIDYRLAPERLSARGSTLDVHQLSVEAALKLAEELRLLPPEVWVYAVAVAGNDYGEEISPLVRPVLTELAARISADIAAWQNRSGG